VRQNLKVAQRRQKDAYDKGVRYMVFEAGDLVKKCNKNVNLIYSGHALSCTALSSASLQACHLNKGNKYFK